MDVLLEKRPADIPAENPYFFASYSVDGHLDPCQTVQKVVRRAGVQNPECITTTNLRKYVATMMQLLDLTQTELEWVSFGAFPEHTQIVLQTAHISDRNGQSNPPAAAVGRWS